MVTMPRVLVVDDEPLVVKSCRRILSEDGWEVDAVESGREGMRRAMDQHFDLVLVDLKMPDADGMEIVRSLRRRRPRTTVIIITGFGTVASAVEAMRLGVADYIEKPFTPDQIRDAAERARPPCRAGSQLSVGAEAVRAVLGRAARDPEFGASLLQDGSRAVSGYALDREAAAAIVSGDVEWIERACGPLSPEDRRWLERRLEAESW